MPIFFLAQLTKDLVLLNPWNSIGTPFIKNNTVGKPLILNLFGDILFFEESILAKCILSFFNIIEAFWYSGSNILQWVHHGV